MKEIYCPYCEHWQDVNYEDGNCYQTEVKHQMQCEKCDKYFIFETIVSYDFEPEKADCLNGSNHNFIPTHTWPKEATKMECEYCGEERTPTYEEMKKILKNENL